MRVGGIAEEGTGNGLIMSHNDRLGHVALVDLDQDINDWSPWVNDPVSEIIAFQAS